MKHTKLVPQVRCIICNRTMYHLHSTHLQAVYGCTAGHIRKLPRAGGQHRVQDNGPDAA